MSGKILDKMAGLLGLEDDLEETGLYLQIQREIIK